MWVRSAMDRIVFGGPYAADFLVCRQSERLRLLFAVPQRSVLGPIVFLMHTAELFDAVAECGSQWRRTVSESGG